MNQLSFGVVVSYRRRLGLAINFINAFTNCGPDRLIHLRTSECINRFREVDILSAIPHATGHFDEGGLTKVIGKLCE